MKDVAEYYLTFLQSRLCGHFSLFCSPALLFSEKPWGLVSGLLLLPMPFLDQELPRTMQQQSTTHPSGLEGDQTYSGKEMEAKKPH